MIALTENSKNKLIEALETVSSLLLISQGEEKRILIASIYGLNTGNFSSLNEILNGEDKDCGCS